GIAQRPRLLGIDLLIEQLAFERAALVKRQGRGRLDRLDAGIGRALVAGAAGDRFARSLEQRGRALAKFVVAIADAGQGALVCDAAGEGDRRSLQVGLGDDLVDDAELVRFLGRDVAARDYHLDR